jgi:ribosome maturation factor RimP
LERQSERGQESPLFYWVSLIMIDKDKLTEDINSYLLNSDKFLVEVKVSTRNKVSVFIDGDKGVSISDCALLSRHIEALLDRDKEDFELEVSSVGLSSPLIMDRQYRNNIGRLIAVFFDDNTKVRGKLVEVLDNGILIEKEIVKKGKKKKNPDTDKNDLLMIPFSDIREAKIIPAY